MRAVIRECPRCGDHYVYDDDRDTGVCHRCARHIYLGDDED